ncbi:YndM family protein [Aquibacillus sp. 3ASR75-11]|uniref:YndM family protein n=1 Tax=Terrihalobacillus insolitus TaxID=2950438 RepID=A0A9X3WW24_9BACI|nr:DUF2512 family protein [Terrihalobacillus insolitus]MDC3413437.1 YndM family protein [Terrihalobacillus insolitus]MDC3425271.1 YndM family protein [Terrihalobacillus insolitus]
MSGLLVKLVTCPVIVVLSSWLFTNVNFAYWYQPIILGVILAVVGYVMEVFLLKEGTIWVSTMLDFAVSVLLVYYVAIAFQNTVVTFWGAVLTAVLLSISEIFQHSWLVKSNRTRKEPIEE